MTAETFASRLAGLACETYRSPAPEPAIRSALIGILDTLGVALAGANEDCVTLLAGTPGVGDGGGKSLIWGTSRRTSALDAALINGTASHALDYDDLCAVFGGHHSAPLVAPLLAVAEERGFSGQQVVNAYITGVETEVRMARALHPEHYNKGWHPTSTIGVFGVSAAIGCLLQLDQARLATALSISASFASGLKANFGSMTKPLHVGHCARSGLLAALLAERGFDAGATVFEDKQGYFAVFNGSGKFMAERALENWWTPYEVEGPSVGVKQFPCCGSTHAAITAALELVQSRALKHQDVEKIEVLPNVNRLAHTNKPNPQTPLDGKFSVQYVVARAIASGFVGLEHFSEAAMAEPDVVRLLRRVEARPHPDMPATGDKLWGAEVRVILKSGEVLSHRIEDLSCRDGNYPMRDDELAQKFKDCAGMKLPADKVDLLFANVWRLPSLANVHDIVDLMES